MGNESLAEPFGRGVETNDSLHNYFYDLMTITSFLSHSFFGIFQWYWTISSLMFVLLAMYLMIVLIGISGFSLIFLSSMIVIFIIHCLFSLIYKFNDIHLFY